ncbi:hypothetical protein [Oleomonas cavernae]|uniref:hypothetical protein n=1 Tax=Oleomonas cavernae TaxID=2320859 RepID=UPI0011C45D7F|nr:hypothetical protein [Oleomonas cavernae]
MNPADGPDAVSRIKILTQKWGKIGVRGPELVWLRSSNTTVVMPSALKSKMIEGVTVYELSAFNTGTATIEAYSQDTVFDKVEVDVELGGSAARLPPPSRLPPIGRGGTKNWSIASPGGATGGPPGLVIGFNIFIIRQDDLKEMRSYISPIIGVGVSYEGPELGKKLLDLKKYATIPSAGDLSFTAMSAKRAFDWSEIESSGVRVSSASAGVVVGYSAAMISFWNTGQAANSSTENMCDVTLSGRGWQFGVGGYTGGGALIKIL